MRITCLILALLVSVHTSSAQSLDPSSPSATPPRAKTNSGGNAYEQFGVYISEVKAYLEALPVELNNRGELSKIGKVIEDIRGPLPEYGYTREIRGITGNKDLQDQYGALKLAYLHKYLDFIALRISAVKSGPNVRKEMDAIDNLFGNVGTLSTDRFLPKNTNRADGSYEERRAQIRKLYDAKFDELAAAQGREGREKAQAEVAPILEKYRSQIAKLGFSRDYLQAPIYLNRLGQNLRYRTLEEWLALVFERSSPTQVTMIRMPETNNRGVSIKLQGKPSVGVIFSLDGGELFVTHSVMHDRAERLRDAREQTQIGVVVARLAGDM